MRAVGKGIVLVQLTEYECRCSREVAQCEGPFSTGEAPYPVNEDVRSVIAFKQDRTTANDTIVNKEKSRLSCFASDDWSSFLHECRQARNCPNESST